MTAEDFARVAARITRVVAIDSSAGHANTAGVMAIAAAHAFNAGSADSRRVLLLARGQLTVFGVVREEVASELRRLAQQRDEAYRALVEAHYPLLS
jgi:ABC-type cobalamin transport system ATPase subunit